MFQPDLTTMLLPFASMGHVFSKRGRVVLPWSRIIRFDLFRNNYSHASIPFNSLKFLPFYSLILHPGGCLFVPPTVIRIYFFFFSIFENTSRYIFSPVRYGIQVVNIFMECIAVGGLQRLKSKVGTQKYIDLSSNK